MTKAAGKLYLAGEYAVVSPGQPALIAAINWGIETTIQSSSSPTFHSVGIADPIPLSRKADGQVYLQTEDPYFDLAKQVLQCFETLVSDKKEYAITVTSDLANTEAKKYGLGSSGAISMSLISSLNDFYQTQLSLIDQYKLGVLSQVLAGYQGSFGDLAASAFGGLIYYQSPNRKWLEDQLKDYCLSELIKLDWPGLVVQELAWPEDWHFLVGWTGEPASTQDHINQAQENNHAFDKATFLERSQAAIEQLVQALHDQDFSKWKIYLEKSRQNLLDMTVAKGIAYEVPQLKKLVDIAKSFGAASKVSGSGGGDCGFAVTSSSKDKDAILTAWKNAGILPLDLNISPRKDH